MGSRIEIFLHFILAKVGVSLSYYGHISIRESTSSQYESFVVTLKNTHDFPVKPEKLGAN